MSSNVFEHQVSRLKSCLKNIAPQIPTSGASDALMQSRKVPVRCRHCPNFAFTEVCVPRETALALTLTKPCGSRLSRQSSRSTSFPHSPNAIVPASNMTDLTAPTDAKAANGTFPADDAAGQTVAAIAESEKISAGNITTTSICAPS